jgi:hypothetical protein
MLSPSAPQATAPVNVDIVAIVVPPAVFYGLALTTFLMRMHARWRATGLQLDDAFLAISMVSDLQVMVHRIY